MKAGAILAGLLGWAAAAAAETTPCRVTSQIEPAYPQRQYVEGVNHGEARLMLRVDPQGRLEDVLVTAYSHRGFADTAQEAVRRWKFEPSRIDGEPVYSTLEVSFRFNYERMTTSFLGADREPSLDAGRYRYEAVAPAALDRALVATARVSPTYPKAWRDGGVCGRALVGFYVDEQGRVRMPMIVAADRPELGWIALAAIQQWRFTPPTQRGRPALVRAAQNFEFGGP